MKNSPPSPVFVWGEEGPLFDHLTGEASGYDRRELPHAVDGSRKPLKAGSLCMVGLQQRRLQTK